MRSPAAATPLAVLSIAGHLLAAQLLAAQLLAGVARADAPAPRMSADAALKTLLDGNRAFVAAGGSCARQSAARRGEVSARQHPIAIVVGCADSRVPPEALFGQGLGDLFTIRVAGNVIDDDVLGSIEYAVEHLGVPLVIVLGHERCGAVEAALAKAKLAGHVATLVERVRKAIARAPEPSAGGDSLEAAVRANIAGAVADVRSARPLLAPLVQAGKLEVVGARYDLDTGAVEILRP